MLPELWKRLDSMTLVVRTEQELPMGVRRVGVRIPSAVMEADELIGILTEIALAETTDPVPGEDEPWEERRDRRAVWRLGSFTVFLCNLDGVLAKQQEWMAQVLEQWFSLPPPELSSERARRAQAIARSKKWRDKVFAHTAYAAPRKEDSPIVRANTLAYASGSMLGIRGDHFTLGGASYCILNEPSEPNPLTPMSMTDLLADAEACIEVWSDMVGATFDPLWQLSDREIFERCTCARIEEVARCKRAAIGPTSVTRRPETWVSTTPNPAAGVETARS